MTKTGSLIHLRPLRHPKKDSRLYFCALGVVVLLANHLNAQSFTEISTSIEGFYNSSVSWGDYDNDGDLDILLIGTNKNPASFRKIYRNDDKKFFVDRNPFSEEVLPSAIAWGDYDNDGDLDYLFTSAFNSTVFQNNNGNFVDINAALLGNQSGSAAWGDYDNDGDLDILLTGDAAFGAFVTKVYRNDSGKFSDIGANLIGVTLGSVAWGDYDNDSDLDVLLIGFSSSGPVSKIYRNEDGKFVEDNNVRLTGINHGTAAWGDYDQDGDLDILLAGTDESIIYNNTAGNFVNIKAGLPGVTAASAAWGDYDNDGDLDILLTGKDNAGSVTAKIYQNSNNSFIDSNIKLEGVSNGSVAWGDFDNDNDLDILLTGKDSASVPISKIYRNDISTPNTLPKPPTNLGYSSDKNAVTLSWSPASDLQTAQKALTYNIRVGSTPGSTNIVSPMADRVSGFRKVQLFGNANHQAKWTIKGLKNGKYFWSVQAIDNVFAGSKFADEDSFFISDLPAPEHLVVTAGNEKARLEWNKSKDASIIGYRIYRSTLPNASTRIDSTTSHVDTTKTITSLTNGVRYYFRVTAVDANRNESGYSNEVDAIPTLFIDTTAQLIGAIGSVEWGDYDNDNDLDILLAGNIYRNDNKVFVNIKAGLKKGGSGAWGDYDNDGDLDLFFSGKLYRNDDGDFIDTNTGLMDSSAVAWGDYDNDGDLDILLTSLSVSRIYRNDKGTFVEINAELKAVASGPVAWGDYDKDGDLDILLTGQDRQEIGHTKVYRNDNGKFIDIETGLEQVKNSSAAWGDYDNDGDLDILLTGLGKSNLVSKVYDNDAGLFIDINADLIPIYSGAAVWGDYDNDGDLDIMLTGKPGLEDNVGKIYQNANGKFIDTNLPLPKLASSSLAWGDYDNDGDLDILVSGEDIGFNSIAGLFRNDILTANSAPSTPTNLVPLVEGSFVNFVWNPSTDRQTIQSGLTYNIRVGTVSGGSQIVSPMAESSSGYRRVVRPGNTNHRTRWKIKNLPDGTYYWSVQAIDHAFAGSAFAPEQSFTIVAPSAPQNLTGIPGHERVKLVWNRNTESDFLRYRIYFATSPNANTLMDSTNTIADTMKTITGLKNGTTYFFRIIAVDRLFNVSGFSNEIAVTPTAEPFINISASLAGVVYGSANWGDFDDDGDLDVLLTGAMTSVILSPPLAKLYRNEGNNFVDTKAEITGVQYSSADWGDYDNDGDLDVLITGESASDGPISRVYRNDKGTFINSQAQLIGVRSGSVAWGDYDNDGDLDILLTGAQDNLTNISKIYKNNGGRFEDIEAPLQGIKQGSVEWGDYDNDGDMDILLSGAVSENSSIFKIYSNKKDTGFVAINAEITRARKGIMTWADYDSDGDLDILVTGSIFEVGGNLAFKSILYRNDGGKFFDTQTDFQGVSPGRVVWGDYDNDGDPDILLTGLDRNLRAISEIYRNDNGSFVKADGELLGVSDPATAWGDFDNDGDLDILLTGANQGFGTTRIYRNNHSTPNQAPSSPESLKSSVRTNTVTLGWKKATDNETSPKALTYNLRIGTTPGGVKIVSPMADPITGYRKVPKVGNTNQSGTWTITNLPVGLYYWSVQAIDNAFAGSAFAMEDTFRVSKNTPPRVNTALPDTFIYVGVDTLIRDLNAPPVVFTDADGDRLTFQASSSDTTKAKVNLDGSVLKVIPKTKGSAEIAVLASDGRGGSADTTFDMLVLPNLPPEIMGKPSIIQSSAGITVTTTIVEDVEIKLAELWYKEAGDSVYTSESFSREIGGNSYRATIRRITQKGWECFIKVEDIGGLSDRLPETRYFSIQVEVAEPGIVNNTAQPNGIGQTSYRLISIPLAANKKNPRDVLGDELLEYNIKKWRFYELLPDQSYSEFPKTSDMEPGKAFWLNVKEAGKRIATGAGKSNRTDTLFSMALNPKWNFIGNPFYFTMPIKNLRIKLRDALIPIDPKNIRYYAGAWNDPGKIEDRVTALLPFEGYAIYADSTEWTTLFIDPDLTGAHPAFSKSAKLTNKDDQIWSIHILAQCQQARDIDNIAAVYAKASKGWDAIDQPEPPVVGEYVSVYFVCPPQSRPTEKLCVDARPQIIDGEVWEFEVKTNILDRVDLLFEQLAQVPDDFEIWLIDENLHIHQNLRQANHYSVAGRGIDNPKRLKLIIGKRDFIEGKIAMMDAIPTNYELSQNFPNPFNPATTIRFGLPVSEKVRLKIYDLLGGEIATLLNDEFRKAGYHAVVWDGRNLRGQYVANGIYFYQIHAGSYSAIKKMALIK